VLDEGEWVKNIGFKYQLRITTFIPVLLVALLFALFYNGQLNHDLNQHMSRLGDTYVHQLMPTAQLAILRNDKRTLQELIDAHATNPEIKALAFYNARGELIAYRGGKHPINTASKHPKFTGDYIKRKQLNPFTINFIAPITGLNSNLYAEPSSSSSNGALTFAAGDILGWISIDLDTKSELIQRYQMYITTIFITLIGLLLSLTIHFFLSKRIYLPIARLRRSMKQILHNEFETEIIVTSVGELGIIEKGLEHLQLQYLNMVKEQTQNIEIATADLQHGLELLEEKNIELSMEKKKTEEKNRQKSELIANMSHEIRTPMTGVIGFANVLLDSKLDPLQTDYVKTIKTSAENLLTIINDILDYSKMDAGKFHLDCIPIDFRACIDEVLALIAPTAHRKGIDLIPSTAVDVPKTMLGDPLRIKQMLSNLVSNAVKFTERGYVLLRTHIEEESDKDYHLSVSVIDTGIGILEEDQATLFTAFNQADTTITRRYGGSGLGLVICKKLAEQMHGRISITSELNKGSTFTLSIKLEKLASYEVEKHQAHRFSNLKALCFDDNPLQLEAICNGLGFWGIHCTGIQSFKDLANAFKTHPDYNLAFVSVNQGCESQMAQVLKKQIIPSILVSKWPIQEYQDMGAKGFLFKPTSMQKLYETIDSLINNVEQYKTIPQHLETLRTRLRQTKPALLIAEDNVINQMLLNSILGDNAVIDSVDNGEDAVAMSHRKAYQAILLDMQMPKLSGLDAAPMIKAKCFQNQKTPIILISANDAQLTQQEMNASGIALCLKKPIDEQLLLKSLLSVLENPHTTPIDWALCLQKVSGNQSIATDFLGRFVAQLSKDRQRFIELLHEKNIKGLENEAHKLLGACCFCGVPDLQSHVAHLEKTAKQASKISQLQIPVTELIKQIDAVMVEYENVFQEHIAV
jgi:two-component system sensor histidine kinase BarA